MKTHAFPLFFVFALACSSEAPPPTSSSPSVPSVAVAVPESDAAVYLVAVATDDAARLSFDVMARGASKLYGLALRVRYPAGRLALAEITLENRWKRQLHKEAAPGDLAIAMTHVGKMSGIDATSPTKLGRVVFEVKERGNSDIAFVAARSKLIDDTGAPVATTYSGARVTYP